MSLSVLSPMNDKNFKVKKHKRHTSTAPEDPKPSRFKLPEIDRHARTAPVPKKEKEKERVKVSITLPSVERITTIQPKRNAKSEKLQPPETGYYNKHYMPPTLKLCKQCHHFWRYFRTDEITFMAALSEDAVDLYDIRKTQRRLKVLININDVDSPQRHPIRRKPLPPGVCYVCSHLDVEGKYQHSHSYLYKKGFFHKCGHHPKTPYPTLIASNDGEGPENVFNFNKQLSDEELKLSVSVRVKSRRDTHSTSPVPIFGQTHFDTAVLNGVQLESKVGDDSKFHLPSIFAAEDQILSGHASLRSSRNSKKSNERGSRLSGSTDTVSWRGNSRNTGSWKNSNKIGTRRSGDNWKINPTISDRSFLEADGYVRRDVNVDDGEFDDFGEPEEENGDLQLRPKSFSGLEEKKPSTQSDRPFSENLISPASSRLSRPKGAKRSSDFGDDEGHLKYHHRSENESLPHDGFSIVSRENSNQTPLRSGSQVNSKLSEQELALVGSQISRKNSEEGRALSQSSSSFILQKLSGGMANHWCTCHDVDYSQIKCEECLKVGGHEKWCVHARSTSRQGNCPHCGKPIMKTSKRASNLSFRGGSQPLSKSSHQSEEKRVKFEDDRDEILINQGKFFDKIADDDESRMKSVEDDDIWTTTEELYENGIDPNIHKRAYLKALFELRMSRLSKINELDESWILDRISKPTFSYFKLRPGQEKANLTADGLKNIGLTADNARLPKTKNSMKHIFGKNIKVDDFYPGGKKNPRVTVTVKREKNQQTMPIHSFDKSV